ncbi:radical SAM domain protein [Teredinibacter turnerae T7901]|uniref:Radical SAM domain protein n=1 Tax=Teredinibacter turnerae (strain ATCC 39867 / T7901) TaxID=377629 RepID=C5BUI2_TERTT|nr:radical SAM protein [Teredinibacter turnerae]ACR13637.1 radical SAM domain protein [Teredinibacter turnerae T7901]
MSRSDKHVVEIDSIKTPIVRSPGFGKKGLSDYKLDLMGLCSFGCSYCSSNAGSYLRINRQRFLENTHDQLGQDLLPAQDPGLMFVWPDVLERLSEQLSGKSKDWGTDSTLMFSMLTDSFSPYLVKNGITQKALEMLLERTRFRIRVLTKNSTVGSKSWITFFQRWPGRFTVGLSIGSLDDAWARRIERGTSLPSARLKALHKLQEAGIPTYGMLCPIFPDLLEGDRLEALIDGINPGSVETVWAEPYNDRANWKKVRAGYAKNSSGHALLSAIYEDGDRAAWSGYARELYQRLARHSRSHGWADKLLYLLYEKDIVEHDAKAMAPFKHILFQGAKEDSGLSKNRYIQQFQRPLIDVVTI